MADFLRRTFAHLLVDEAFDLNQLDVALLRIAIENGIGLTLVGDPWQCILEWRGSRPELVRQLVNDFGFETIPITVSHRYRTAEMRALASQLIREEIFTTQSAGPDQRPDVVYRDR